MSLENLHEARFPEGQAKVETSPPKLREILRRFSSVYSTEKVPFILGPFVAAWILGIFESMKKERLPYDALWPFWALISTKLLPSLNGNASLNSPQYLQIVV